MSKRTCSRASAVWRPASSRARRRRSSALRLSRRSMVLRIGQRLGASNVSVPRPGRIYHHHQSDDPRPVVSSGALLGVERRQPSAPAAPGISDTRRCPRSPAFQVIGAFVVHLRDYRSRISFRRRLTYAAGAARINEPRISRPPRVDLNGDRAIPTTPLTATAIQGAMQRTGVHVGDLIVPTYRDQHDRPPNSPTCGRLGVPLGGHPRRQPCSFRIMGHMTCQVWGP